MSLVIKEFVCPCCGENRMNERTFDRFVLARSIAGVPFVITSGWRCKKHNADPDVGGSDTSSHLRGYAADIACNRGDEHRYRVEDALKAAGFKRIGIGKDFVHADDDPDKNSPRMWVY